MFKCVVSPQHIDAPGVCYTGFESKEECIQWLKDKGFHDTWHWAIFLVEIPYTEV